MVLPSGREGAGAQDGKTFRLNEQSIFWKANITYVRIELAVLHPLSEIQIDVLILFSPPQSSCSRRPTLAYTGWNQPNKTNRLSGVKDGTEGECPNNQSGEVVRASRWMEARPLV